MRFDASYFPYLNAALFNLQSTSMLFSVLAVIIHVIAASPPTGNGPCYYIDGSLDESTSACYYLDTVGASICCQSDEDCLSSGSCTGAPDGPIGPDDDDKAIWRRSCSDYTGQDLACLTIAPCKSSAGIRMSHSLRAE